MFDFSGVETQWWKVLLTVAITVAVLVVSGIIVAYTQKKRGKDFSFTTRDLTYGAVCLAIAYVLSFFGYKLPYGGTITPASILPIIVFCYYFGFAKGALLCAAYMVLQLFQNPYIVNPYSLLLDYAIPYLALCATGIFSYNSKRYNEVIKDKKRALGAHWPVYIGCVIYILIRYACHVTAGVLFYADYAWEGWGATSYSFAYNSFVLIDFAIAMVALTALLCSKTFNTFMASNRNTLQNTDTGAKNNQRA